jgi:ferredoxin--NADP+ reductase
MTPEGRGLKAFFVRQRKIALTPTGELGSSSRPVRIAIIGAGPAGFYAAGTLLKQKDAHVSIDMIDRLPTPYGLVRYGVAPDHQKIKSVTRIYERTMKDSRVRYFGNVHLGADIAHADLKAHYDQIVYAVGAQSDRKLGIPGENLEGSFSATEFVAWYNGHPDFRHFEFDLGVESVALIGVGNVAMDVTRILAKSVAELKTTDITDYALDELQESNVRRIHIFARRGPVQAKFTNPEIKELGELEIADVIVNPADLVLDDASQAEMEGDRTARRNLETLQKLAERGATGKPKQIIFHFLRSPTEITGTGRAVSALTTEKNALQATETGYVACRGIGSFTEYDVGLVFRSIGYRGVPIPGVPFFDRWGIIPNEKGRVTAEHGGAAVPGEYTVGWAKRGPTGVIGTNKPDAVETVKTMLEDVKSAAVSLSESEGTPRAVVTTAANNLSQHTVGHARPGDIIALLQKRGVPFVSFADWQILEQIENERGAQRGQPRVKITDVDEMLRLIQTAKVEALPS